MGVLRIALKLIKLDIYEQSKPEASNGYRA
jgi:hypothetical protein